MPEPFGAKVDGIGKRDDIGYRDMRRGLRVQEFAVACCQAACLSAGVPGADSDNWVAERRRHSLGRLQREGRSGVYFSAHAQRWWGMSVTTVTADQGRPYDAEELSAGLAQSILSASRATAKLFEARWLLVQRQVSNRIRRDARLVDDAWKEAPERRKAMGVIRLTKEYRGLLGLLHRGDLQPTRPGIISADQVDNVEYRSRRRRRPWPHQNRSNHHHHHHGNSLSP